MSVELTGTYVLQETFLTAAVATMAQQLVEQVVTDAPDPGPRKTPRDLRLWLARLRLLEAVPFGQLVADSALLPPESIRFFHLDRGWTDSLIEGALSVGTVTTSDRAALEQVYGVIRSEVDEAERLIRMSGWEPGAVVPTGSAGPITGFLLRSRMVSGWPGLHVRGYAVDNLRLDKSVSDQDVTEVQDVAMKKLRLLRLERLAPAVLLVLFDGLPVVVHVEEPRSGVQFGVDESAVGGRNAAEVKLRDASTGERISPVKKTSVPFRRGAPGVIHMRSLAQRIKTTAPESVRSTTSGDHLDAADFALQMLQFPYRAVFADRTLTGGTAVDFLDVFFAQVGYAQLAKKFTTGDD